MAVTFSHTVVCLPIICGRYFIVSIASESLLSAMKTFTCPAGCLCLLAPVSLRLSNFDVSFLLVFSAI